MAISEKEHRKVKFQPLQDRVLVKRTETDTQVKGGLVLPDSAKKKQETAVVIAVGPGKSDQNGKLIAPSVKPGETILMDKYSGQDVTVNKEEYVVVRDGDIIATVMM